MTTPWGKVREWQTDDGVESKRWKYAIQESNCDKIIEMQSNENDWTEIIRVSENVPRTRIRQFDYSLLVGRIMMKPPFGPGMPPRTRMRLLSVSTRTMVRLRIVTRSFP